MYTPPPLAPAPVPGGPPAEQPIWLRVSSSSQHRQAALPPPDWQHEAQHLLDDTLTEAAGLARNFNPADRYAGSF